MELTLTAAEVLFETESDMVLVLPTITVPKLRVALATPIVPPFVALLCPVRAIPPHPVRDAIALPITRMRNATDKMRVSE
jgi:hypothetical protein